MQLIENLNSYLSAMATDHVSSSSQVSQCMTHTRHLCACYRLKPSTYSEILWTNQPDIPMSVRTVYYCHCVNIDWFQ